MNLLPSLLVPELHGNIRLVRGLVLREPNVTIDSEQGPAEGLRISYKVGANRSEPWGDILDEPEAWLEQLLLIPGFVPGEPVPIIVLLEVPEKREELRREVRSRSPLSQTSFHLSSIVLRHIGSTHLPMRGVQLRSSYTT